MTNLKPAKKAPPNKADGGTQSSSYPIYVDYFLIHFLSEVGGICGFSDAYFMKNIRVIISIFISFSLSISQKLHNRRFETPKIGYAAGLQFQF